MYRAIDLIGRVLAKSPGDRGSILSRVIPKTQKVVLYSALLMLYIDLRPGRAVKIGNAPV